MPNVYKETFASKSPANYVLGKPWICLPFSAVSENLQSGSEPSEPVSLKHTPHALQAVRRSTMSSEGRSFPSSSVWRSAKNDDDNDDDNILKSKIKTSNKNTSRRCQHKQAHTINALSISGCCLGTVT